MMKIHLLSYTQLMYFTVWLEGPIKIYYHKLWVSENSFHFFSLSYNKFFRITKTNEKDWPNKKMGRAEGKERVQKSKWRDFTRKGVRTPTPGFEKDTVVVRTLELGIESRQRYTLRGCIYSIRIVEKTRSRNGEITCKREVQFKLCPLSFRSWWGGVEGWNVSTPWPL